MHVWEESVISHPGHSVLSQSHSAMIFETDFPDAAHNELSTPFESANLLQQNVFKLNESGVQKNGGRIRWQSPVNCILVFYSRFSVAVSTESRALPEYMPTSFYT